MKIKYYGLKCYGVAHGSMGVCDGFSYLISQCSTSDRNDRGSCLDDLC